MLKNYIKVAVRNLIRNRLYSLINIVGLGVAIALCITGFVNYQFSQSFDSFHENKEKIYTVNSYLLSNNQRVDYSYVPSAMASALEEDIPGIEKLSRISVGVTNLQYDDKVFNIFYHLVDRDFFNILSFDFVHGNANALNNRNNIVISTQIAEMYFGSGNPMGKRLVFNSAVKESFEFTVAGVIEQPPLNSSVQLGVYVPYERQEDLRELDPSSWEVMARALFVQLEDNVSVDAIESKLNRYVQISQEANPSFNIQGFFMVHLPDLAYKLQDIHGSPFFDGMHPAAINAPSVIAVLVLLLACFNFVNTSIAFASKRLKEIGVRKVMGGMRKQIIIQFMGENIILCLMALLVGVAFAEIFVPAYDSLWPDLSLTFKYTENLDIVGFLIGLLLFTAIASGAYPAFYISKFRPVNILKGRLKLAVSNPLIKTLLTFQFAISIATIISAFMMNDNAEYMENLHLGYDLENILIVEINDNSEYELFRNEIKDIPEIDDIAVTMSMMGRYWFRRNASLGEVKVPASIFNLGKNYFEFSGLTLLKGRSFDSTLNSDIENSIMVNEKLVEEFALESPLGQYLKIERGDSTEEYQIIGVVQDFYHNGISSEIEPTILGYVSPENYRYATIRYNTDKPSDLIANLESAWRKISPNQSLDWAYMDEIMTREARTNESIRLVFIYIAIMVIVISSMGLFALISLNITRRTKEMGIRKVLGASIANIGALICKEFVILLTVGSVIASVMAYFMVDALLSSIWTYYAEYDLLSFLLSTLMVFTVAILTVGYQVYTAAVSNPVESIRDE